MDILLITNQMMKVIWVMFILSKLQVNINMLCLQLIKSTNTKKTLSMSFCPPFFVSIRPVPVTPLPLYTPSFIHCSWHALTITGRCYREKIRHQYVDLIYCTVIDCKQLYQYGFLGLNQSSNMFFSLTV